MVDDIRNARFARLGAMALMGGAGAVVLVWLLFFWISSRNAVSGLDDVTTFVVRVATAVPAVLIISAHLAIARQLLAAARGVR
jgi:hypothetical protein